MKNLVFPEFLDFVEARFGFCPAPHAEEGDPGYREMLAIADALTRLHAVPRATILYDFGAVLFHRLAALCPIFFGDTNSSFEFLASIDRRVSEDLGDLRPEVWVPMLECRHPEPGRVEILFLSDYPLADLAAGLIDSCGEYFEERIGIERRDLPPAGGQAALFIVTRTAAGHHSAADVHA